MRVYFDADADLELIRAKRVAILGYGNQGRAQALNLKDSGVDVIVALREDSARRAGARSDGFDVMTAAEAAAAADLVVMLAADEDHGRIYAEEVAPQPARGRGPVLRPRPLDPLRPDRAPPRSRHLPGRAQGARHRAPPRFHQGLRPHLPLRRRSRTRAAPPRRSPSLTPRRSAPAGSASSRPASPRNARRICSTSRPCSGARSPN